MSVQQPQELRNVPDANDLIAAENRKAFDAHGCFVVNLMSAPGSGKTPILERTPPALRGHFGGECHLDARMIRNALPALRLDGLDVVFIENAGGARATRPRQVKVLRWVTLLALVIPVAAAAAEEGVPLPRGWIGTTSDWLRGLGIAFALLDLVLLAFAWRSLRPGEVTPTARGWLFVAVGLVPLMVAFLSFAHGLETSATVRSCGACHVMTPFVEDLRNVKSDTLAATHFKNRYIRENQCYMCHSDYGLAGTLQAKLAGLGHVWRYTVGSYALPITIAAPYPNLRCLECHGASQKFLHSPGHPGEDLPKLMRGETSCLDCHGPAHPGQKKAARR